MYGGHIPGDYAGLWQDTLVMKGGFGGVSLGHAHLLYDTEAKAITAREARMELTPWNIPVEPDLAAFTEKITGPHRAFLKMYWRIRIQAGGYACPESVLWETFWLRPCRRIRVWTFPI